MYTLVHSPQLPSASLNLLIIYDVAFLFFLIKAQTKFLHLHALILGIYNSYNLLVARVCTYNLEYFPLYDVDDVDEDGYIF